MRKKERREGRKDRRKVCRAKASESDLLFVPFLRVSSKCEAKKEREEEGSAAELLLS